MSVELFERAKVTPTMKGSYTADMCDAESSKSKPRPYRARGQRLRNARERVVPKLTQKAVAKACNVTQQSVASWEAGTTSPQTSHLMILTRLYGVPERWILRGGAPQLTEGEVNEEVLLTIADLCALIARIPSDELRAEVQRLIQRYGAAAVDEPLHNDDPDDAGPLAEKPQSSEQQDRRQQDRRLPKTG